MGFANVLDQGTKKRGRERCGESKNRVKKSGADRLWRKTEGNDLREGGKKRKRRLGGGEITKENGFRRRGTKFSEKKLKAK